MLKAQLVRDATFVQISRRYKLQENIRCAPDARWTLLQQEKPVANLFEAYVAGLFYSYLKTSSSFPTPPRTPIKRLHLSDSDDSDESDEVRLPSSTTKSTHGQAMDFIESWLRPLFTSIASWAIGEMQNELKRIEEVRCEKAGDADFVDEAIRGSLAKMNEHFIAKEGCRPVWSESTQDGMWTMKCKAIRKDGTVV